MYKRQNLSKWYDTPYDKTHDLSINSEYKINDKLKNLRGKFYERHGAKILITYHPAALLRDPSKKKLVWEDMQIVMKEVGIDV